MPYFVLVGSTDPLSPARTFDRVDDEKLAVEIVRVVETLLPATWSTILPLTARPGVELRSHLALVESAQLEYDSRDDETRTRAADVREEALRRLGREPEADDRLRPEAEDGQFDQEREADGRFRARDDDVAPLIDPERHPEGRPRGEGFLARRRSKRQQERRAEQRAELEFEIEIAEAAEEAPAPAWETLVLDPELPVPFAAAFEQAQDESRKREDDAAPAIDPERPRERHRSRGPLGRRSKRERESLATEETETELAQSGEEVSPPASETVPPVPALPEAKARPSRTPVEEPQQPPPENRDDEAQAAGSAIRKAKSPRRPRRRHEDDRSLAIDLPQPPEPAEVKAKRPRRPRRGKEDDRSPAVDLDSVEAPATADRGDPPEEKRDLEQAAATGHSGGPASETIGEPESGPKRRRGSRTSRPPRRAERQEEPVAVEQLDTASLEDAQATEGESVLSQRIAEYTLAQQRRSGADRRSGIDRRQTQSEGYEGHSDRRGSAERRSGRNRRRVTA